MLSALNVLLASAPVPNPVPDSGATGLLLGLGILSLGLFARYIKNRKR